MTQQATGNSGMGNDGLADHHGSMVLALKNVLTWVLIGIGSLTAEKVAVYLGIIATLLTIYSIVKREFFTKQPPKEQRDEPVRELHPPRVLPKRNRSKARDSEQSAG